VTFATVADAVVVLFINEVAVVLSLAVVIIAVVLILYCGQMLSVEEEEGRLVTYFTVEPIMVVVVGLVVIIILVVIFVFRVDVVASRTVDVVLTFTVDVRCVVEESLVVVVVFVVVLVVVRDRLMVLKIISMIVISIWNLSSVSRNYGSEVGYCGRAHNPNLALTLFLHISSNVEFLEASFNFIVASLAMLMSWLL
jgi:hypothetical protein